MWLCGTVVVLLSLIPVEKFPFLLPSPSKVRGQVQLQNSVSVPRGDSFKGTSAGQKLAKTYNMYPYPLTNNYAVCLYFSWHMNVRNTFLEGFFLPSCPDYKAEISANYRKSMTLYIHIRSLFHRLDPIYHSSSNH